MYDSARRSSSAHDSHCVVDNMQRKEGLKLNPAVGPSRFCDHLVFACDEILSAQMSKKNESSARLRLVNTTTVTGFYSP